MTKWKPIIGFDSGYEVSDDGRIRTDGMRRDKRRFPPKELRQFPQNGYLTVTLWIEGKPTRLYVHRLVLSAFDKECPLSMECNHKDGCKSNNKLENLEWVSRSDNLKHAIRTGLKKSIGKPFKKGCHPHNKGAKRQRHEYETDPSGQYKMCQLCGAENPTEDYCRPWIYLKTNNLL